METPSSSIIADSCQYTPIYFVEDPNIAQARSYVITQNDTNVQKPVSDTLKKFYENSGKLENNLINCIENDFKPRILKKQENKIANNLKLVSFLLPKREIKTVPCKQVVSQTNNVLLKPVYIANTPNITLPVGSTIPKMDVNSKIVKLKDVPNGNKTPNNGKTLPKKKPNENQLNKKHTSVQLLKLGETYHSLNQLSEQQMKIVNHALKIFSNPQNTAQKPAYDPVTNTKYIYKVVSPKDLTVVGKNNVIFKPKKTEIKKAPIKKLEKKEIIAKEESDEEVDIPVFLENAVTRSGRKVKISKNILPEATPDKPKKKNETIACCQCSSKFSTQYRLQRHYNHHPTHAPEYHSNLFNCFMAIIKSGSEEDRANIFLQQLEQLITKIKSCLPCLTKTDDVERKSYNVTDEVSRVLGITSGNYKLNMDALNCIKDKNGHCSHNPAPFPEDHDSELQDLLNGSNARRNEMESDYVQINPAANWSTITKNIETRKHKSELTPNGKKLKLDPNIVTNMVTDNIVALDNVPCVTMESDRARIGSTVKWPNVGKRIEIRKQKPELSPNAKKLKLDTKIETDVTNKIVGINHIVCDNMKSDCAQINSAVKWSPVSNTIENRKQDLELGHNANELKLDTKIETDIVTDDIVALLNENIDAADAIETKTAETEIAIEHEKVPNFVEKEKTKPSHIQFHSTHFDIRSSPIKPSSTNFRTFQINTENMPKFKEQIIQPLQLNEFAGEANQDINTPDIFKDDSKKETDQLTFELAKDWNCDEPKSLMKPDSLINEDTTDSYMKSDSIQPALLHVKDNIKPTNKETINDSSMDMHLMSDPGHSMDTLNFLETLGNECISYSETDIRNNSVDFHLDLFSFNST